jgi:hypothetical protein
MSQVGYWSCGPHVDSAVCTLGRSDILDAFKPGWNTELID